MAIKARIAIVGGDQRELTLAGFLVKDGYDVRLCGFEKHVHLPAQSFSVLQEAVANVDAVILPLAGIQDNGCPRCPYSENPPVIDEAFFSALPKGIPVFIGWAREAIKKLAGSVRLVEVADDDELAILNSIPTAEGAIAIAMERTPITIHGSSSLVIGLGRCGLSLARMLGAIGARVSIAARKAADLARAQEMGFESCSLANLNQIVHSIDIIFNSAPAKVLTAEVLSHARQCQLIVDIASSPGGTDFAAAEKLGIPAVLAPGLPGKVAPVTAGTILARVYPRFLEHFGVNRR